MGDTWGSASYIPDGGWAGAVTGVGGQVYNTPFYPNAAGPYTSTINPIIEKAAERKAQREAAGDPIEPFKQLSELAKYMESLQGDPQMMAMAKMYREQYYMQALERMGVSQADAQYWDLANHPERLPTVVRMGQQLKAARQNYAQRFMQQQSRKGTYNGKEDMGKGSYYDDPQRDYSNDANLPRWLRYTQNLPAYQQLSLLGVNPSAPTGYDAEQQQHAPFSGKLPSNWKSSVPQSWQQMPVYGDGKKE